MNENREINLEIYPNVDDQEMAVGDQVFYTRVKFQQSDSEVGSYVLQEAILIDQNNQSGLLAIHLFYDDPAPTSASGDAFAYPDASNSYAFESGFSFDSDNRFSFGGVSHWTKKISVQKLPLYQAEVFLLSRL